MSAETGAEFCGLDGSPCGDGMTCDSAADLLAATFPSTLAGSFTRDLARATSCGGSSLTNVAWFRFFPGNTYPYRITATNPNTGAGSRIAVFDGTSCAPLGAEVACAASATNSVSITVSAPSATSSLLIAFFTHADSSAMTNPSIDVAAVCTRNNCRCATVPVEETWGLGCTVVAGTCATGCSSAWSTWDYSYWLSGETDRPCFNQVNSVLNPNGWQPATCFSNVGRP
jgi:hypothetical protein